MIITLANGHEVDAVIVGQLAIHDSEDEVTQVVVTHVLSGCAVAIFSWYEDAKDFATKANEIMNFDDYSRALVIGAKWAKASFSLQSKAVKELRDSYTTYMPDQMARFPDVKRKQLTKRVTHA